MLALQLVLATLQQVSHSAAFADNTEAPIEIASRPEWVEPIELELPDAPLEGSVGVEWLLVDVQELVVRDGCERFVRSAKRVISEQGLQDETQVAIEFDPSIEQLVVHDLTVHRAGQALSRSLEGRFQLLRREEGLEQQMFDGQHTAVALLEDIRIGDTIEVSYTIVESSSIFEDRFVTRLPLQLPDPVARLRRRISLEEGRQLHLKTVGSKFEPWVSRRGSMTEYVWDLLDTRGKRIDADLPAWFNPLPWVQVSEFESWSDVANWALELFEHEPGSPGVRELAERVAGQTEDPLERVLLALRSVQAETRYVAIELGDSSYRPHPPEQVLERGFGDCKDQALLLVSVLEELGIPALPALVNTTLGEHVAHRLPAPTNFDHAIVRAEVDGEAYWLDPTRDEVGPLDELGLPDFAYALIVSADQEGLTQVVRNQGIEPSIHSAQSFAVQARGGAGLEVTSTYRGEIANQVRNWRGRMGDQAFEKSAHDYWDALYPGIRPVGSFDYTDRSVKNELVVVEHYAIPVFFQPGGANGPTGRLFALELDTAMTSPVQRQRTTTLGLDHPNDIRSEISVRLPDWGWTIEDDHDRIRNASFHFERQQTYHSGLLNIAYEYRSLRDHVPVPEIPQYLRDLDRAQNMTGIELWKPAPVAAAPGFTAGMESLTDEDYETLGSAAMILLLVVIGLVGALRSAFRRDRRYTGLAAVPLDSGATVNPFASDYDESSLVWREGRVVVMDCEAQLPGRCVRCNRKAVERVDSNLTYTPTWLLVLLLAPIVYVGAALMIRKKAKLSIGLCEEHRRIWRRRLRVGLGVVGTGAALIGAAIVHAVLDEHGEVDMVYTFLPAMGGILLMMLGASMHTSANRLLTASFMDDRVIELKGASREFLDSLQRRAA